MPTALKPLVYGAPGRIRTSDRLVRSQVLYPAELRAHCSVFPWSKSLIKWRRERDSNPRRAINPYSLSRGALSTTQPSLRLRSCQFRDTSIDVVGRGITSSFRILLKVGPHQSSTRYLAHRAGRVLKFTVGIRRGKGGMLDYSSLLSASAAASALFSLWIRS